jgi:colanic acid/amylovoran biosynthesis protein
VLEPDDPLLVKSWIGHAGLVFSSRFHGCVSALSQGVPCIGTSWSHKYQHLYADYACADWLVGLDATDGVLEDLMAQCTSPELKRSLLEHSAKLQQLATNMWLEVADKTSVRA